MPPDAKAGAELTIVFLGTSQFAVPTLRALSRAHRVVAVVTRPDRPAGRGRRPRPCPVKLAAEELGLPVFQPERVSAGCGYAELARLAPDLLVVVAFGEILSKQVLALPRVGAINLHASLLPKYRGAAPIVRALLAGERETGVSSQWMVEELDAGPVILQRSVQIGEDENHGSLHDRLAQLGAEVMTETLALVARAGPEARQMLGRPQPAEGITYAPPVMREELVIDWGAEAAQVVRQVRAFSPTPGARTLRGGKLLKILAARPDTHTDTVPGGSPGDTPQAGEITGLAKEGFWVQTGKGRVVVLQVQPEARGVMSAAEYIRGYHLRIGERLGE